MTLVNRVSAFFLAALAVCLGGSSLVSYLLIRSHLYQEFDQRLRHALNVVVAAVEVEPDDVKWQPSDHTITLGDKTEEEDVRWLIAADAQTVVDHSRNLVARSAEDEEFLRITNDWRSKTDGAEVETVGAWRMMQQRLAAPMPKVNEERDIDEFPELTISVGLPTAPLARNLFQLSVISVSLPLGIWLLAAIAGRIYCRRALEPVRLMSDRARSMANADFGMRLPVSDRQDELTALAESFNQLLDQLQSAYDRQRRFSGDAAHQLKTPLTVLRGQIDVALRKPRDAADYQQVLGTLQGKTHELQQLVEALLFLARADGNEDPPDTKRLTLSNWLASHLKRWADDPRYGNLFLQVDTDGAVHASPALLGQAIDNLINNALKYSPSGSPVSLRVVSVGNDLVISVSDEGPGVPESEQSLIFEPFYRSPQARQTGKPGAGLGLSLAARIVRSMNGSLRVRTRPEGGSIFSICLPALSGTAGTGDRAPLAPASSQPV